MILRRTSEKKIYIINFSIISTTFFLFLFVCFCLFVFFNSLSSLVKSNENGNGVTFRSGADVTMDIGVSGFGGDSAIDRAMQMVRFSSYIIFKLCSFNVICTL